MNNDKHYIVALTQAQKKLLTTIATTTQINLLDFREQGIDNSASILHLVRETLLALNNAELRQDTCTTPDTWHSVDHLLPPCDTDVLVFDNDGRLAVAWLARLKNGTTKWFSHNERLDKDEIMAWMPIPDYQPNQLQS